MKKLLLYILLLIPISAVFAQADTITTDADEWMTTEERATQSSTLVIHEDSMPLTQKEMDRRSW